MTLLQEREQSREVPEGGIPGVCGKGGGKGVEGNSTVEGTAVRWREHGRRWREYGRRWREQYVGGNMSTVEETIRWREQGRWREVNPYCDSSEIYGEVIPGRQ